MGKLCGVLLSVLVLAVGCEVDSLTPSDTSSLYPDELSESELKRLSFEAMGGSAEAAERVAKHYWAVYKKNYMVSDESPDKQARIAWELIGAENGSGEGRYNTAYYFSGWGFSLSKIPRAVFWLRLEARNGYNSAMGWLVREAIPLDFDFPSDDSFPDSYKDMTAEMLGACEEAALNGSGKAALLLGGYYMSIVNNVDLAEYWYRIGAQNGNPLCQSDIASFYGLKGDRLNGARATFWGNKAEENGYTP
ncbi:hypothetical protein AGMMS50267_02020 [Spirochaetia bacterium]|nr:hypothetical protein AGMMS50267_02020 [Spirochaetia bacterium]